MLLSSPFKKAVTLHLITCCLTQVDNFNIYIKRWISFDFAVKYIDKILYFMIKNPTNLSEVKLILKLLNSYNSDIS